MFLLLLSILNLSLVQVLTIDPETLSHSCLKAHNEYRTRHGAPPLKWSGELAEDAQNWANHLAAIDQMERDPTTQEGENIFYMYGGDPSEACDRAVDNWYSEVKNYDFKNPQENKNTGHFRQLVWKKTKEFGVGTAKSKSGNFFLVARYSPKGNTDVTLTLNQDPKDNYAVDEKSEEPATSQIPASHKPDGNDGSEPVITVAATKPPDPSVPMTTAKTSYSESNQKSSSSLLSITESDDKGVATSTTLAVSKPVENHGNEQSKHSSHDKKSLGSPLNVDATAGMKVKPPKSGKDFRIELRFPKIEFTEKMEYPSTREYHQVRLAVTSAIMQLYEDDEDFQEVQLSELRNGSVIATVGLIFAKEGPGHLDKLTSAVATGKLGDLDVSRDYVAAEALPNGYLKLTRPHQPPPHSQCPQPCSNPTHCFPSGCHVTCCSFHPTPSPTVHQHHYLETLQAPPSCPGNCDSSCLPQCTVQCCLTKEPGNQEDALQPDINQQTQRPEVSTPEVSTPEVSQLEVKQPEVSQLEVKQPEASQPEVNYSNQGYSCPATCPFACYPQCTPECCSTTGSFVTPYCSNDCAQFCSVGCPQECCGHQKSSVHNMNVPRLAVHKQLFPSIVSPKVAYSFGSKYGALRNSLYGKGLKRFPNAKYDVKALQAYRLRKISLAYRKAHPKYVKNRLYLDLGAKGGSLKNALSFQKKSMYSRPGKPIYKNMRGQRPQPMKAFISPTLNKARYSSQKSPGIQTINGLKSKDAPLDIKFAYRYGNRLLVPIDMPKMGIKELRGGKFISVPAFTEAVKER